MNWNPWSRIAELEKEVAALSVKLANAHFRDPKTGRIGKKGAVK